MKQKLLSAAKYALFLSLGCFLLIMAFKGIDLNKMLDGIKSANYWWIGLSVMLAMLANISRALRWNMLIQPLGYRPKSLNTLAALMAGYLANLAVPRMGEVTRCGALSETDKVPFNVLIGTVIIERTLDVLMLGMAILLAAVLEYQLLGSFIYRVIVEPIILKVSLLLSSWLFWAVLVAIIITLVAGLRFIIKNRDRFAIVAKAHQLLLGIWKGMITVFKMENKLLFWGHTAFIWTIYFLVSYLSFYAIKDTSGLSLTAGLFTLVLGGIGMTAPVQGGIGVYHLLVSSGLVLFGVSQSSGLLYATIVHTTQTLMFIVLGAASIIYIFFEKRKALVVKA